MLFGLVLVASAVSAAGGATGDDGADALLRWGATAVLGCAAVWTFYRTWRVWPAASAALVVIRLDGHGPALRKGRFRDDTWFGVPWESITEVEYAPLTVRPGGDDRLRRVRVLRFVPGAGALVPDGPPGMFDALLALPPRESVLCFVASPTWDEDVHGLLDWVRTHRPGLPVQDAVTGTAG